MPSKEIKELRQAGKLAEAYSMAKAELEADNSNIWCKRNLSWVLYAQLDQLSPNLDEFIEKINEVKELELPDSEELFFDNISIVIAKAARIITNESPIEIGKIFLLFDNFKNLPLKRNSKWYSVLFKAMHKGLKETNRYLEFADWWDFKNFQNDDFQKERLPNGKEVMALAEQAYISYAKHLLPKQTQNGDVIFLKEKAEAFIPILSNIVENHPELQYPAYFNAKLLLALGNKNNMLESLLPFAKKKRNDFWVWEILAEVFPNDSEELFACYCKALTCKSPDEMLISLRQKMARLLIERKLHKEAKTEINLLLDVRKNQGYRIPDEVNNWINQEWYKSAEPSKSNFEFFKSFAPLAESILFSDVQEETVIVEFVNEDKKILNFIASENKFGFLKFDRFISKVKIGDTLNIRFQGGSNGGAHQIYTLKKIENVEFSNQFIKDVQGIVKIPNGQSFGFLEDVFIHPTLINKLQLVNGQKYCGKAIKAFNKEKNQWTWKLF